MDQVRHSSISDWKSYQSRSVSVPHKRDSRNLQKPLLNNMFQDPEANSRANVEYAKEIATKAVATARAEIKEDFKDEFEPTPIPTQKRYPGLRPSINIHIEDDFKDESKGSPKRFPGLRPSNNIPDSPKEDGPQDGVVESNLQPRTEKTSPSTSLEKRTVPATLEPIKLENIESSQVPENDAEARTPDHVGLTVTVDSKPLPEPKSKDIVPTRAVTFDPAVSYSVERLDVRSRSNSRSSMASARSRVDSLSYD